MLAQRDFSLRGSCFCEKYKYRLTVRGTMIMVMFMSVTIKFKKFVLLELQEVYVLSSVFNA